MLGSWLSGSCYKPIRCAGGEVWILTPCFGPGPQHCVFVLLSEKHPPPPGTPSPKGLYTAGAVLCGPDGACGQEPCEEWPEGRLGAGWGTE